MGMGWRRRMASRALVLLFVAAAGCATADGASHTGSAPVRVVTTTTTTTSTTSSPVPPTTATTVAPRPPSPPAAVAVLPLTGPDPAPATTCADALAYLAAHQAPGFVDSCADGSAFGHLGVTCVDAASMCPGAKFIRIACPAPFVYMNEAHNSWMLTGRRSGIDPYGQGTAAEQAACARHR